MKKIIYLLPFLSTLLCSCNDRERHYSTTKEMLVASQKVYTLVGQGSSDILDTVLIVKYEEDGRMYGWTGLVRDLEGFDYEPGYEYRIKVKINHVISPKSHNNPYHLKYYKFLKLISKEKKESEGINDFPKDP